MLRASNTCTRTACSALKSVSANSQEYYGENILHISVIHKNAEMVEWILNHAESNPSYKQKLLSAAATGNFFKL